MPTVYIPEHINPFRFAEQQVELQGAIRISDLQRLATSLSKPDGDVEVDIHFGVDDHGIVFFKGHLETKVWLQCQRCMELFKYQIVTDFVTGVANSEEKAESFPESYDTVIANDNLVAIRNVVEDELILSLPLVPKHEEGECEIHLPYKDSGWDTDERNPFVVLKKSLTRKSSKKE